MPRRFVSLAALIIGLIGWCSGCTGDQTPKATARSTPTSPRPLGYANIRGEVIEFDWASGRRGSAIYSGPKSLVANFRGSSLLPASPAVGAPSVRSGATGRELYVAVQWGADGWDRRIIRLTDRGPTDLGVNGYNPAISPDGRWLAYIGLTLGPTAGAAESLRVRDLASGAEKVWSYKGGQSVEALAWSADSRDLFYQLLAEGSRSNIKALSPETSESGPLAERDRNVDVGLGSGESAGRPFAVDGGVVVPVLCCREVGGSDSARLSLRLAVLTPHGVRRIPTAIELRDADEIIALDPTATTAIVFRPPSSLMSSGVDGTPAVVIGDQRIAISG